MPKKEITITEERLTNCIADAVTAIAEGFVDEGADSEAFKVVLIGAAIAAMITGELFEGNIIKDHLEREEDEEQEPSDGG